MRNHAAQLAIIKQPSRQELHSTAGNCQADDRQESCINKEIKKNDCGKTISAVFKE